MKPAILRDGEGAFELLDWTPEMTRALDDLERLADPGAADPAIRARLFPDEGPGEAERASWRRHAHPELHALFASAREIVLADLSAAERGRRRSIRRLVIPPGHVPAWVAALNTARLSLASTHGVGTDAMAAELQDLDGEVRAAVVRISLYGELQWALLAPAESWPEDDPGAVCLSPRRRGRIPVHRRRFVRPHLDPAASPRRGTAPPSTGNPGTTASHDVISPVP